VRQPSTLVYASLFVFALYVSAVLAQKFSPARHLRLFFYEFVPYDLYAAYEVYMWGHLQLIDAYPYHVFGAICFVVNFFYVAVCRWLARKCTLSGEALVFRNYYNY